MYVIKKCGRFKDTGELPERAPCVFVEAGGPGDVVGIVDTLGERTSERWTMSRLYCYVSNICQHGGESYFSRINGGLHLSRIRIAHPITMASSLPDSSEVDGEDDRDK